MHISRLAAITAAALALSAARAQHEIPADPEPRWFKGNLHTHTFWSDGNDFPEMVVEWYRDNDYNFLALSDHNTLSQGQRWMP
ncbi:MAG: PHP domain-containing protein, partial [Phycisphaerales bacterium JB041]